MRRVVGKGGEENACEGFGKTVIFTDNAEGVDAQIFESLAMRYGYVAL